MARLDQADSGGLGGLLRSALAGARADLEAAVQDGGADLHAAFAQVVAGVVGRPGGSPSDVDVATLEALLDGWASGPDPVLAAAAIGAYGEVGSVRPDWWSDEVAKLRQAAADPRPQVRAAVARAATRLLATSPHRTADALAGWAADPDPLVAETARRVRPPV